MIILQTNTLNFLDKGNLGFIDSTEFIKLFIHDIPIDLIRSHHCDSCKYKGQEHQYVHTSYRQYADFKDLKVVY